MNIRCPADRAVCHAHVAKQHEHAGRDVLADETGTPGCARAWLRDCECLSSCLARLRSGGLQGEFEVVEILGDLLTFLVAQRVERLGHAVAAEADD